MSGPSIESPSLVDGHALSVTAAVPVKGLDVIASISGADGRVAAVPDRDTRDLAEALADVDFLVLDHDRNDVLVMLGELPRLRVVQTVIAGTDRVRPLIPSGVTLCNGSGIRDIPVAEWALSALLGAYSGLLRSVRVQSSQRWQLLRHGELAGKVVLILGLGSIGRSLKPRLEALGAEVIGIASAARDGVHGPDELEHLLPRADALVVLAPLTESTRGVIGAEQLALLRDGALVVSCGRGEVVDTAALLPELQAQRLEAVIDVVDPEPLPAGHALWSAPGAYISSHIAGNSAEGEDRAWEFAGAQLRRYINGEPLLNVVLSGDR
jgi:phosphoglycerate dehydrogenase-like enzyme